MEPCLDRFAEDGYARLGLIATPNEVAELAREEARFRLPVGYGAADNQTLRVNIQLCHRSAAVRRFCTGGAQIAPVVRLLGPDVCLTHQQFVTKLPDGPDERSDIPMHQDNGYGRLEPTTDVTIWMPLVDTDERNGCLWIVPGSHQAGLLEHGPAGVNPVLREATTEREAVPLPLEAGHAVAFTGLTLHGSGPNHTEAARPALFVRYCDPRAVMIGNDEDDHRPVIEDAHSWVVAGEA